MKRSQWFDRCPSLGQPLEGFPDVLERLRGTPARLEERTVPICRDVLVERREGRWSIQENVGHLLDLEPTWDDRFNDLLDGSPSMRPADATNDKTHRAMHNQADLKAILATFRESRTALVRRLEALSAAQLSRTLPHPRLGKSMSVVDLALFVADHDDHHLSRISEILRELAAVAP